MKKLFEVLKGILAVILIFMMMIVGGEIGNGVHFLGSKK